MKEMNSDNIKLIRLQLILNAVTNGFKNLFNLYEKKYLGNIDPRYRGLIQYVISKEFPEIVKMIHFYSVCDYGHTSKLIESIYEDEKGLKIEYSKRFFILRNYIGKFSLLGENIDEYVSTSLIDEIKRLNNKEIRNPKRIKFSKKSYFDIENFFKDNYWLLSHNGFYNTQEKRKKYNTIIPMEIL